MSLSSEAHGLRNRAKKPPEAKVPLFWTDEIISPTPRDERVQHGRRRRRHLSCCDVATVEMILVRPAIVYKQHLPLTLIHSIWSLHTIMAFKVTLFSVRKIVKDSDYYWRNFQIKQNFKWLKSNRNFSKNKIKHKKCDNFNWCLIKYLCSRLSSPPPWSPPAWPDPVSQPMDLQPMLQPQSTPSPPTPTRPPSTSTPTLSRTTTPSATSTLMRSVMDTTPPEDTLLLSLMAGHRSSPTPPPRWNNFDHKIISADNFCRRSMTRQSLNHPL